MAAIFPASTPYKPLNLSNIFSVAPMLNWTDRHCRFFHRILSRQALLYTEMVATHAILQGDKKRFLSFNSAESPVSYQLGGNNPAELADCAQIIEDYGYAEINLNVGCPSNRVQSGRFGACLMRQPNLVAECVNAMQQRVSIPVTVKSRIGIDKHDSYAELLNFISTIADAGCKTFIIHARKAWLSGLSPKQNRQVPPLRYDIVCQIKKDFPELEIILNGGITTLNDAKQLLTQVDGVMVGREAYHNPYLLAEVDAQLFAGTALPKSRHQVALELIPYISHHLSNGEKLHSITRHILGLFHGISGASTWRRYLSTHATQKTADETVLLDALNRIGL